MVPGLFASLQATCFVCSGIASAAKTGAWHVEHLYTVLQALKHLHTLDGEKRLWSEHAV